MVLEATGRGINTKEEKKAKELQWLQEGRVGLLKGTINNVGNWDDVLVNCK